MWRCFFKKHLVIPQSNIFFTFERGREGCRISARVEYFRGNISHSLVETKNRLLRIFVEQVLCTLSFCCCPNSRNSITIIIIVRIIKNKCLVEYRWGQIGIKVDQPKTTTFFHYIIYCPSGSPVLVFLSLLVFLEG